MLQFGMSLCIFTILAIGASQFSRSETEAEKNSSTSSNIRSPTSTSDGDGINFVISGLTPTAVPEIGEDYDKLETENLNLTFIVARGRSARKGVVKMTINEINNIFNKRGFRGNKNRHLTSTDKIKARECRRKNKLYFRKNKKCHQPLVQGPCKNSTKWIVAIKGRLDGVCRERPCLDEATPILHNGTCVPIDYHACPRYSRLYLNKRGEGYCDCEAGYSRLSDGDGVCYRDFLPGPCDAGSSLVLVGGKCVLSPCPAGEMMWQDGSCHPADPGLAECEGDLELVADLPSPPSLSCRGWPGRGRVITGNSRHCRRGRVWSSWRGSCVRLFG